MKMQEMPDELLKVQSKTQGSIKRIKVIGQRIQKQQGKRRGMVISMEEQGEKPKEHKEKD